MDVRRGRVGVKIVSLNSGKVVFENDSEKYFMPASNMKNLTVAAGFERLGPDFRFVTSVYANSAPLADGIVKGDLRIFGRGDVSISTAFFGTSSTDPETYYRGIDRLADKIVAAGVKRIEGSIVGDETYFKGFPIPLGWEWDDLQWYYGAEISALPINDNAVDLSVRPGAAGGPCVVTISPPNLLFQVINTCVTVASSTGRSLGVHKRIHQNILEISGTMSLGAVGHNSAITVSRPGELFVAILKQRLERRGVMVTGNSRLLPPNFTPTGQQIEITRLESLPYREIASKTMKPSQNMYTETILWTLGEQFRGASNADSSMSGLAAVRGSLRQMGIPDDAVVQYDGSGLSRHNLVTPSAVVELYRYMAKRSPNAADWRNSLTIGGIDGTLRNRFKGTAANGNIRGKTGTLNQVSALSGYVTTAAGAELVVSIIVNGVPTETHRTSLTDDIVVYLANYDGKID
jgi:serine-type D-Ala-D-Ala carboxypeptidase/endopeptidase (penicillin-binding protein 4)